MRRLTPLGWKRLNQGMLDSPVPPYGTNESAFWSWGIEEGSGFKLTTYLIIGMLGGTEREFPGFEEVHAEAHPVRLAWTLDETRRELVSDFLMNRARYMK